MHANKKIACFIIAFLKVKRNIIYNLVFYALDNGGLQQQILTG